jgi:hypothetical protein
MGSAIQRGIDRGEFRPVDVPRTVRLAMAPIVYAVVWKHSLVRCDQSATDWDAFIEGHIDLFLRGLEAGGEPAHEMRGIGA